MYADSGVLKSGADKPEHHGWLYRRFWRKVFLRQGMQDAVQPWKTVMGPEDQGWMGEQHLIEQKQRAIGHM